MDTLECCQFCGYDNAPFLLWIFPRGCVHACFTCSLLPLRQALDLLDERGERVQWDPPATPRRQYMTAAPESAAHGPLSPWDPGYR